MPKRTIAQLELALSEVRRIYSDVNSTRSKLDDKAKSLMGNSSIVIALFAGLQGQLFKPGDTLQIVGMSLVLVLFMLMLLILVSSLRPRSYKVPIAPTEDAIKKAILSKPTHKRAILQVIGNYLAKIRHNRGINIRKARFIHLANLVFILIMLCLLFLSFFAINI